MMKVLLILFLAMSLMAALAFHWYGSKKWKMKVFCFRMAKSSAYREFYGRKLLIVLFLYHFVYQMIFGFQIGILLSMILTCAIIRRKTEETLLQFLNSNNKAIVVMALVALGTMFYPKTHSLGFTCSVILISSFFFPSRRIMNNIDSNDGTDDMEHIAESYFKTDYNS